MRIITRTVVVSAFAGVVLLLATQVRVVRANSSFAGHWQGKMDDLSGIDLDIEEHDGKISGHIVFYYQERSDPNGPLHVAAEYPVSFLVAHVEGKILAFEAEHHKCDGCTELDQNTKFCMELTDANEALLWRLEQGEKPASAGMKLVRQSNAASNSVDKTSPLRPAAPPENPSVAGAWQGRRDGLAGLDLTIERADGNLSGSALLYSEVGPAIPLLSPHLNGSTLTFELQRHKCSQCDELGPNAKFLMELSGPNEANLWMQKDRMPDKSSSPDVKLTRRIDSISWRDPSPHRVQFVIVEYNVRLEVLDWGGTGRSCVLLTGSGNTGHIFDDFAPKLASLCHVYAITRRGYGASSHPDAGYTEPRLAEDVLEVLNALKIVKPVIIGHSAAGGELTRLGDDHSDRLAGLVYLDAAFDPADFPAASPEYMALYQNLSIAMRDHPGPTTADKKSFAAYRDWRLRRGGVAFPETELHNQYETNPDGSVGPYKASTPFIQEAFGAGALKRDYSRIRVPILAFFNISCSAHPQGNYACIERSGDNPGYVPKNNQERAAIEAYDAATVAFVDRWKDNLRHAQAGVRIVDLPGAGHNVFLSREDDVLREIHVFLLGLH
jgi:non-heme chloroperoxidase